MRNILLASLAVLALSASSLHASTLDLTLQTGLAVDALGSPSATTFDGVAAEQYVYSNTIGCILYVNHCHSALGATTSTLTVTVADVSSILTLVNVNDICTQVEVLGNSPACQSFAFSATNVKLGDGQTGIGAIVDALVLADVSVGVEEGNLNIDGANDGPQIVGAGVQGGNFEFQFTPPPSAATPEPSSLSLLGTGLAGVGELLRRRLKA